MDMFETRIMLQALEQLFPPKSFLLDMFFKGSLTFESTNVDLDIIKGNRKMAAFVRPIKEGKVVDGKGYSTRTVNPGYIKEKMRSTAADLMARSAGNTVYAGETLSARAARRNGDDLRYLDNRMSRREEWMAAKSLDEGKVTISGDGFSDEVDFLMPADHKVTLLTDARWSESTTCNPLADLRTWARKIQQDSGLTPDVVVFGLTAWDYFEAWCISQRINPISLIQIQLGKIDPQALPSGAVFMGSVNAGGFHLNLYTYNEWYEADDSATQYPMVPDKKVWVGCTSAQNVRLYGAIQDMDAITGGTTTYVARRFPKSWVEKDPSVRWIMLQSAPLPALNQSDAFISAQVAD